MHARELRRSPRVPIPHMVVALPDGNHIVQGNISVTGVGFELPASVHLKIGDPIAVQFVVPERAEPLILSAVITRAHAKRPASLCRRVVGARFVDIDVLVENPLFRFVEEAHLLTK